MTNFVKPIGTERRTFTTQIRAEGNFELVGYAATFNSWSKDLGGFRERIAPGAFQRSIQQKADVKCLFNHTADNILGRTKNGTLVLEEDSTGLKIRCKLNDKSSYHRDIYAAVQRGDVSEMSFAFTVPQGGQTWRHAEDGMEERALTDVDLIDVSPVVFPAYSETSLNARSAKIVQKEGLKNAVEYLRRAARIMARTNVRSDVDPISDFASAMDYAHQSAELSCQISKRAYEDVFDSDDDEVQRGAHMAANAHLDLACENLATTRARYAQRKVSSGKVPGRSR